MSPAPVQAPPGRSLTHVPSTHVVPPEHVPQTPPQPSGPHCADPQLGWQGASHHPSTHVAPPEHVPQTPPQPSGPHTAPPQDGTQPPWQAPSTHVDGAAQASMGAQWPSTHPSMVTPSALHRRSPKTHWPASGVTVTSGGAVSVTPTSEWLAVSAGEAASGGLPPVSAVPEAS